MSGTPAVGVKMSTTNGSWSNSPVAYGYQWQDCNSEGKACSSINGATNASYTPTSSDVGYALVAVVTAINGGGSTSNASAASAAVVAHATEPKEGASTVAQPGWTIEYRVPVSGTGAPYTLGEAETAKWGQKDDPVEATGIFPPDEPMVWPATDYKRATINYLDAEGRSVNAAAPSGGISTTEYNSTNNVVRTLSADNRATALQEGSKSAEAAKRLDSEQVYTPDGEELLEKLGPEHTVKLSDGSEVSARDRERLYYDEGAPKGEAFGLVTKSTDGALLANGEERDGRTSTTSYSGQEGLGWELRKPTSTTSDPAGLDLVNTSVYDKGTGNVIETRSPGGNSETIYPFAFSAAFGSGGTGNGQFKGPAGSAIDAAGNVWVVDEGNSRIEKFSSAGAFIAAYGSKGTGNGQFQAPWGIAINQSTGNVYVADRGNNRIEELSSSGAFVATFGTSGSGALSEPTADAIDSAGDVWVSDWGHNRLVEFSAEGTFIREAGSPGSGNGQINGPGGLVVSEGSVFVADYYNSRIDQFSTSGASLGQFGSKGSGAGQFKEPYAVTANPSTGALYVTDTSNNRIQELSPAGRFLTSWETWGPSHQLSDPTGLTVGAGGKLYVSDAYGNQVSTWTPPEAGAAHLSYASELGSSGSGNGQFSTPINTAIDGEGNLWVTDCGNNRIEKFSAKGSFIAAYGKEGSGNGQYHCPGGIDINQSTGNVYVADTYGARIEELSSSGSFIRSFGTEGSGKVTKPGSIKLDSAGNVWVPDMSADKLFEFSSSGTYIAAYGKEGSGEVQFKQPTAVAFSGENLYVADSGNHRVQELSNKGAFIRQFGKEGGGGGELYDPEGIAADAAGNLYVVDAGASHVEEFTASGGYLATFATKGSGEGQVKAPIGDAIDAAGDMYVVDTEDNRVEKWTVSNPAVHSQKTIYYSTASNSEFPQCGGHPEWANLVCQTQPGAQPTDAPPSLAVSTRTYNVWDELEANNEKLGSTTRTTVQTYDGAGRALTSEEASTADTSLPKVTNEYSSETGALIKQSTTSEGHTRTITSAFNTLGQLTSYTDGDGNTSKYVYDVDGRVEEMSDGKGSQIYVHDPTTGFLTKMLDSSAGSFSASYDVEGQLSTEGYPNGMTATYTRNAVGSAIRLEYVKTTHCSSGCTWFSDAITPAIHGEALTQTSTLASDSYTYDAIGRLTKTQETPAGKGCVTQVYAYDEESNRTQATTIEPTSEGHCATEGGTSERHIYDDAGRLSDSGVTYDVLGNTTSLPAQDAGGQELTASYFSDNQARTETQNGESITYSYDPAGRPREVVSSGKTNSTVISHYSGSTEAVAWTSEGGESWTRNIPGIDGGLAASQPNGGTPVLQLHDLQGDIVATAALSETETKLLSTFNSKAFGVPGTAKPPKYAWLGAVSVATELPSGVATDKGASYVPQVARALETEPVTPPGAFPNGTGTGMPYTASVSQASIQSADAEAEQVFQEVEAARQKAAAEAAERALEASAVDPHEWAMLTEDQGLAYAEDLQKRADNASLAADFFKFLPKIADELATTARGLAAVYEGFATNVKLCALASDRCFVTVGYVTILGFSFITSVAEEPCFSLGRGYDLCQPSEYVRRRNEHGRD
jgi:YD repeat-containing protein